MSCLDILVWNCRGAGNSKFKRNFSELMKTHKPGVVALLETKVSLDSMGIFFKSLGLKGSVHVDPTGRVGGIWLLWDPDTVSVNTTEISNQVIHATIKKDAFEDWVFSAVYASPNHTTRETLWEELVTKAAIMNSPWLLAGDMNETTSATECQSSSNVVRTSQNRKFRDRIDSCNLMDMGATGPKFTWSNGRKGMALVQKRLDRALCNADWRSLFPEGMVKNLPRTYSDHSPLLIHVFGNSQFIRINRPFRFEAAWLLDNSFSNLVALNWKGINLSGKISSFSAAASNWNKNAFGNIF